MTGSRWLERYVERHGPGPHVRAAVVARIRRKVRALSPEEARGLLLSFRGLDGMGSAPLQIDWIGSWSQSLDHVLRQTLGRRMLQGNPRRHQ